MDIDEIEKHDIYLGKRIKRGLFGTFNRILINADVNDSYNIIKKAFQNAFAYGIVVSRVNTESLSIFKLLRIATYKGWC